MARTDVHLDAMLRHLGSAYYDSLHGRASHADVTRALDTVEEHLHEQTKKTGVIPAPGTPRQQHTRRWTGHVRDVMTTLSGLMIAVITFIMGSLLQFPGYGIERLSDVPHGGLKSDHA